MAMTKIVVILKTHGQISKKQCFEKYCSCEKLCQFSLRKKCPYSEYGHFSRSFFALYGISYRS